MVQMQGGNDVDYPGVISRSCQRSSCAVIGRPAGRRGEEYKTHLLVHNAIKSTCCLEYFLSRHGFRIFRAGKLLSDAISFYLYLIIITMSTEKGAARGGPGGNKKRDSGQLSLDVCGLERGIVYSMTKSSRRLWDQANSS